MRTLSDTQYIQQLVAEGEHCHQDFKFEISDARKIARSLSAFANTEGGRLLVGVKDNGKIAGIRSEEEIYMIEAAANMYCQPKVEYETQTYVAEGRTILMVRIEEASTKPIYALDEANKPKAYIRMDDETKLYYDNLHDFLFEAVYYNPVAKFEETIVEIKAPFSGRVPFALL